MLLVLGQARQRVALPKRQQLVLGPDSAWWPVEGGAGVVRLARERVRVGCGRDVDAGPRAVEGQRAPGAQGVLSPEGEVMLRGVEGGRSVGEAAFGAVVARVLVQFPLCWVKRRRCARRLEQQTIIIKKPTVDWPFVSIQDLGFTGCNKLRYGLLWRCITDMPKKYKKLDCSQDFSCIKSTWLVTTLQVTKESPHSW